MDAFESSGRWWLPGNEQASVGGTLKVSAGGGMSLSVISPLGELKNALTEKTHPIILGSVDKSPRGNEVTLTGSFRTGATFGSFKDARECYHVDRAYFGALLPDEKSFAFKSMRLRLGGLTEWIHKLSGFERKMGGGGVGQVGETVSLGHYTRREPVRAKIPRGEIILGLGLHSSLSGARYEFQEEGQVKVTCDEPISADEFHGRYGHALRCLMAFVCDRAQTIERFSVWRPDAADQEIIVVGALVQPEEDEKEAVGWDEMLFTVDAVDFPNFIPKWFRLTVAYKEACNVYFGLLYGPPPYLDIKFENVANAVLLYYERSQEGGARRDADASRMKAILGGLSPQDRDWLIDRLGVNPRTPLRTALDNLLDRHGDLIDPLLGGRRERFVESVLGTLEYAVRRDKELAPAAMEGADLYWLTEKLRFLLKACFMHETGLSQDAIRAFFARNALFQHIYHEESTRESNPLCTAEATGSATTHASQQPAEAALRPTGSPELEAFWSYLANESPRGRAVAVAAYFDEALGRLLGGREVSLMSKIETAHRRGLLTNNERDDLNELRKLRNLVVHRVGGSTFHEDEKGIVLALKTWQITAEAKPQYETMIVTPEDRLVYVASVIAARLGHRSGSGGGQPLVEPDVTDVKSWPPVVSR